MAETTILIVEDESIVALDLKTRLQRLDYQVIGPAATGNAAVEFAVNQRPDLILMDIHLQDTIDGIAAAQMIQDQLSIPIVYLTAHSDTATLERAKQTQSYGYLVKPFNERELPTTIEMALTRHRMEQQIQRQNQQLQGIVNAMPHGVVLLDYERKILAANRLGQDALMALGKLRLGDRLQHLGDLDLAQLFNESNAGLLHAVSPNTEGSSVFEVSASRQKNDSRDHGWVLILRDVTRERDIEQRIQQQQRLAAVGQLAAGIAHDFNNMLTIMSMTLQLIPLQHADLPADIQQRLATTAEQVERGAGLIQQILDFSRQSKLTLQTLDLIPFLKEIVKMIDRALPENISFNFQHAGGPCVVTADPTQVQQVVMNLIINARDAMPDGGRLNLNLQPVAFESPHIPPFPDMVGKAWVHMTIADNGVGMTPNVQERIFEPFFTTKSRHQGTGLGLAQVYGIIRQHGGFIDVQSVVGVGTTFNLYWPMPDSIFEATAPKDDTAIMTRPQFGQAETLLFVEDDAGVRQSTAQILRQLNYQVIEVEHGQEAITVLEQHDQAIDLVITDMMMPGMSGADLCRFVKRQTPELEVILLTGYAPEAFIGELQTAGFAHILEKPFTVQKLVEIIQQTLRAAPAVTKWVDTQQLDHIRRPHEPSMMPLEAGILHLHIVGTETPLVLPGVDVLILGREAGNEANTEALLVDLTPYHAQDLGVSRQHARLQYHEAGYIVEDLGSRNGTQVNGHRLTSFQPYTLRPGDCVSVGELIIFIYFV